MQALWHHGIEPSQTLDAKPSQALDAATAFQRLISTPDVLCCVLTLLSAHDLAAAAAACRPLKLIVEQLIVPVRLERARAEGGGNAEGSNMVHALHLAETAVEKAKALRVKKAGMRASLPNFLDHIRCEAAFRGQLERYEERIDAIEARQTNHSTDDEIDALYDEAAALENEIHMPTNLFPPGMLPPAMLPGMLPGQPNPGGSTISMHQIMQMVIAMNGQQGPPPQAHT